MTRKRIQFVASLLITAFFLWLAFRNVPLRVLWADLKQIQYWWAIPFCVITLVSMYLRAVRWKYLLEPIVNAPSYKLFPPTIICFALNGILPGRVGEFARAFLVSRDYKVKFSSALATVIVERIADGMGLLMFFVGILAFVPLGEGLSLEWKGIKINGAAIRSLSHRLLIVCVILLAGTILMLWEPFRRLVQGIVSRIPLLPHRLKEGLNRFIETFVHGFHSLRSPRLVFWVIVHTATVWLTVGWSLQIMSYGFPGFRLTFIQGMATAIIICFAIMIPAAPGYWGLYEVGCILALQMQGAVPLDEAGHATALGFSLVAHALQIICTTVPGMWFLWRRQVGLSELTHRKDAERTVDSHSSSD